MAIRNPSSSYKLQSFVAMLCRYRVVSGGPWLSRQTNHRDLPPPNEMTSDQGLKFLSVTSSQLSQEVQVQQLQVQPAPPKFNSSNWVKWLLGSILSLMLPFWNNKCGNLLMEATPLGKAAKVVEEVEVVAEMVEKVATKADNVLAEVAKQLPDNSKLKEAAQAMEHVSSLVAHDAQLLENIIHKVGDVEQDLEELESIVEPILDKIMNTKQSMSQTN